MRTPTGCQALVESMVIGARLAGGLTPERAETLLTIMLEHSYFSGLGESDLRDLLEQACQRPLATLAELRPRLDDPALTFQLAAIVARSANEPGQDILLDAATQLGLSHEAATQILDAGTPPELSILDAGALPEEVYLDVLLAAAAADGRIADEELEHLVAFACSRLELRLLPRHEIEDVMAASLQGFLDHGFEAWMETLALSLPTDEQRRTAQQLAREMIAADHEITVEEEDFMRALTTALGLDEA
jgi:tellurite resistance protein